MSAVNLDNWHGNGKDCFYKDEKSYHNAESISDSLAKAICQYREQKLNQPISMGNNVIKRFKSIYDFWTNAEDTGIKALIKLLNDDSSFGFLEAEDRGLEEIEKIIKATTRPIKDDPLAEAAFDYLTERVRYIQQSPKRTPYELTHPTKVLLIGDGWARREQELNPTIRRINSILNPITRENLKEALQLQRRGYMPDQVYTIDRTRGQMPDYTGRVEEIPKGTLPDEYFDIIYFEGMLFSDKAEEALVRASEAFDVVLPALKENGLIFYHELAQPSVDLIMEAKSGEITQEKLDMIPECVKRSVRRAFDDTSLMIATPGVRKVHLSRASIIASQQGEEGRSCSYLHPK